MSLRGWLSSRKRTKTKDEVPKKRRRRRLPKRLTRGEAALLLDAADDGTWRGERNRCIVEMMYRAGLRVSEVVALRPRDVERDGAVHVWDGKGGVDRTARLDPSAVLPHLDRWQETRASMGLADDAPLFCRADGGQLTTRSVQMTLRNLKERAGIAGSCTPHVLRHTFASELLEEGFSTREVQVLLGHASVATTEIYTWVTESDLAAKVRERTVR